jgi:hypothetical protein
MNTNGNRSSAGTLSSGLTSLVRGATQWITEHIGRAKEPRDGDCLRCGETLNFYVAAMTGRLVSWCVRCREELVVERRILPRD